jgi:hypothetical protein
MPPSILPRLLDVSRESQNIWYDMAEQNQTETSTDELMGVVHDARTESSSSDNMNKQDYISQIRLEKLRASTAVRLHFLTRSHILSQQI